MSETTEPTLSDIASKVCKHYQHLKKKESTEKKVVLYSRAIQKYFIEWAEERGYSIKEFKSAIGKIIQRWKHMPHQNPSVKEELEICNSLNKKPYLNGSSCISFTLNQIRDFNLNEDSYI